MIVLSGCLGCEIAKLFLHGNPDAAEAAILKYHEQFGEDYYLELIRNGANDELESSYSEFLINMCRKHSIKVVATNDVHRCLSADNAKVKRLIEANLGNYAKYLSLPSDDWLKTEVEMLSKFTDCPEAISTTEEIVNKIETYDIPQWEVPSSRWTRDDYLKTVGDCLRIIE